MKKVLSHSLDGQNVIYSEAPVASFIPCSLENSYPFLWWRCERGVTWAVRLCSKNSPSGLPMARDWAARRVSPTPTNPPVTCPVPPRQARKLRLCPGTVVSTALDCHRRSKKIQCGSFCDGYTRRRKHMEDSTKEASFIISLTGSSGNEKHGSGFYPWGAPGSVSADKYHMLFPFPSLCFLMSLLAPCSVESFLTAGPCSEVSMLAFWPPHWHVLARMKTRSFSATWIVSF